MAEQVRMVAEQRQIDIHNANQNAVWGAQLQALRTRIQNNRPQRPNVSTVMPNSSRLIIGLFLAVAAAAAVVGFIATAKEFGPTCWVYDREFSFSFRTWIGVSSGAIVGFCLLAFPTLFVRSLCLGYFALATVLFEAIWISIGWAYFTGTLRHHYERCPDDTLYNLCISHLALASVSMYLMFLVYTLYYSFFYLSKGPAYLWQY